MKTVESRKWYGTVRTADGKRKQIPLCENHDDAVVMLRRLQSDEDRSKAFGFDRTDRQRSRPLSEHLVEYEEHLRSKRNTERHVQQTMNRIRVVVAATKAKTIDELDSHSIKRVLSVWRQRGRPEKREGRKPRLVPVSVATSNHYARAVKSFSRWLWTEKRSNDDPLSNLGLLSGRDDRRRVRRALTMDELKRLIEATESSGKRSCHFRPIDRSMLYAIAAFTGLRASELASLTVRSFDFDAKTVTVEAGYSKRRRRDVLPLHPFLVDRCEPWIEAKAKTGTTLWPDSWAKRRHGSIMLRRDLERAEIEYEDEAGRVVDFHALRHTFITNLARSGVHPSKAKELARHSTITLTLDAYTHTETDELRDALGSVPSLVEGKRE